MRSDFAASLRPVAETIQHANERNANCEFAACDAELEYALENHPRDAALRSAYLQAALDRGDWLTAASRAASARQLTPEFEDAYKMGFQAAFQLDRLEEAQGLVREATALFPSAAWPTKRAARLLEAREDYDGTEEAYAALRAGWLRDPDGFVDGALFRRRIGRNEAAMELIDEAVQRFPDEPDAHVSKVNILIMCLKREAACAACDAAVARFPSHLGVAMRHADMSIQFLDKYWDEGARRYDELMSRFPDEPEVHLRAIRLEMRAGRPRRAGVLAHRAIVRLAPLRRQVEVALLQAKIMESRGDFAAALNICEEICVEFPNSVSAYAQFADILIADGQFENAEAVCDAAIDQFRFRLAPYIIRAKLAARLGDAAKALEIWSAAVALSPRDQSANQGLFVTRMMMSDHNDDSTIVSASAGVGGENNEGTLANVMMRFESLSAPGPAGCEFGFVQRQFGAEPLGLLRWGEIAFENLLLMLNHRLEGVGDEAQTAIRAAGEGSTGNDEYFVFDTRYNFELHTFATVNEGKREDMLRQWRGRLQFLKRKLLFDLDRGEKIFVYSPGFAIADAQIRALAAALRGYGDIVLLVVQNADGGNLAGSVVFKAPGVMVGYIPRIRRMIGETQTHPILYGHWAQMCVEALAVREAYARQGAVIADEGSP